MVHKELRRGRARKSADPGSIPAEAKTSLIRATASFRRWRYRELASLQAKVEHPLRVIKRQIGVTKVRYCGLAKNAAVLASLESRSAPADADRLMSAHRQKKRSRGGQG